MGQAGSGVGRVGQWVLWPLSGSLLSTRLSAKLASSFSHAFDVSSWEGEQLPNGEGLQVGGGEGRDESWLICLS